jgi:hypothetical protein
MSTITTGRRTANADFSEHRFAEVAVFLRIESQ